MTVWRAAVAVAVEVRIWQQGVVVQGKTGRVQWCTFVLMEVEADVAQNWWVGKRRRVGHPPVHTHTHARTYAHTHTNTHAHTHTHQSIHVIYFTHTHTHARTYARTHAHNTQTHTHTHTHTHKHKEKPTYLCMLSGPSALRPSKSTQKSIA